MSIKATSYLNIYPRSKQTNSLSIAQIYTLRFTGLMLEQEDALVALARLHEETQQTLESVAGQAEARWMPGLARRLLRLRLADSSSGRSKQPLHSCSMEPCQSPTSQPSFKWWQQR